MLMRMMHALIKCQPPRAQMSRIYAFYAYFEPDPACKPAGFARKNDPWEFMNSLSFQQLSGFQARHRLRVEKFLIDALQDAMYLKSLDRCVMTGLDVGMLSRSEGSRR